MAPQPDSGRTPVSRRRPDRDTAFHFSAGEALSTSFAIFGKHLPVLLLLAAAFHALPLLLSILQAQKIHEALRNLRDSGDLSGGVLSAYGGTIGVAASLAGWVLPLAFQAVVTFAVLQTLKGGPPRWGESVGKGVQRLFHALAASFVVLLAIGIPGFVIVMVLGGIGGLGGAFLGILGAAVLAVILLCIWYVAIQVAIVEGGGPINAMGRSSTLTRGARGQVFGVVAVVYGVPFVLVLLLQRVLFPVEYTGDLNVTPLIVQSALGVVFSSVQAVTAVVVYHALRSAKEGTSLDELLAVFD